MFGKLITKKLQCLSLSNRIQSGLNFFLNIFLYFKNKSIDSWDWIICMIWKVTSILEKKKEKYCLNLKQLKAQYTESEQIIWIFLHYSSILTDAAKNATPLPFHFLTFTSSLHFIFVEPGISWSQGLHGTLHFIYFASTFSFFFTTYSVSGTILNVFQVLL